MLRLFLSSTCFFLLSSLFAQPGALDNSFGGVGYVVTPFGSGIDVAQAVAVQPDGKVVVAGYAALFYGDDYALVRYNVDGTLDQSFSGDGLKSTDFFHNDDQVAALALQPDGKILAAGYSRTDFGTDFSVARYLSNGTLDSTFSNDGKLSANLGGISDRAADIELQPDKKILVAGTYSKNTESDFAVIRYNEDGALDNSFGQDGIASVSIAPSFDEVRGMALQPDGKIVLAGFSKRDTNFDFALARFNSNGTLDTDFGSNGIVVTNTGHALNYGRGVALQADGKILLIGYTVVSNNKYSFALLRYLPDGALDPSFNGNGIAITAVGNSYDVALALTSLPDDKILACGYSYINFSPHSTLIQYRPDGLVDSTFGLNGRVFTPVSHVNDQALAIALTPDNKIVTAGRTTISTGTDQDLDFVAIRYFSSQMLGMSTPYHPFGKLRISPNPIADKSVLEYDLTEDASVTLSLYDLQGNLEQSFFQSAKRSKGLQRETLPFAHSLAAGAHVLVVQSGRSSQALRVLKQ